MRTCSTIIRKPARRRVNGERRATARWHARAALRCRLAIAAASNRLLQGRAAILASKRPTRRAGCCDERRRRRAEADKVPRTAAWKVDYAHSGVKSIMVIPCGKTMGSRTLKSGREAVRWRAPRCAFVAGFCPLLSAPVRLVAPHDDRCGQEKSATTRWDDSERTPTKQALHGGVRVLRPATMTPDRLRRKPRQAFSLKGWEPSAQGNALGKTTKMQLFALKGRDPGAFVSGRAPSGLKRLRRSVPQGVALG
jgi:hypothetical protein